MPWSPLPTSDGGERGPTPSRLPDLLDRVLAGLGAPSVAHVVVIHERWAEVVGAEMVAHCSPVSVEGGRLRIAVDSPAWASHLRWSETEILARLDGLIGPGTVTSIHPRFGRR
ncbi:MAG: DciA family protein [Acidimicrobiales bacterium]